MPAHVLFTDRARQSRSLRAAQHTSHNAGIFNRNKYILLAIASEHVTSKVGLIIGRYFTFVMINGEMGCKPPHVSPTTAEIIYVVANMSSVMRLAPTARPMSAI